VEVIGLDAQPEGIVDTLCYPLASTADALGIVVAYSRTVGAVLLDPRGRRASARPRSSWTTSPRALPDTSSASDVVDALPPVAARSELVR
jgi:hypothetical protein